MGADGFYIMIGLLGLSFSIAGVAAALRYSANQQYDINKLRIESEERRSVNPRSSD